MDVNPKGRELAENIEKSQGKSMDTFNIEKCKVSLKYEPRGGNIKISMVVPLVILFSLFKIQIVKDSSKSGSFLGRPFMRPFLAVSISLLIVT